MLKTSEPISKRMIKRLSLVVLSLSITLFLAEVIIRVVTPQPLSGSWRIATDSGLMVNKSSGTSIHQAGEIKVLYRFYFPHLRDTPLIKSSTQILCLGDSYTFGWLLDKKNTYIYHLQQYSDEEFGVNRFHLLNGAAGGWGTADYLAFLQEFGDQIQPDAVLVFLSTGDIGRSILRGTFTLTDPESSQLTHHNIPINRTKRFINAFPLYQLLLEHSHSLQLLRRSILALKHPAKKKPLNETKTTEKENNPSPSSEDLHNSVKDSVRLGNALFLEIKKWCDERGIPLYVTTTGRHNHAITGQDQEPTRAFMAQAESFFSEANIPYADISPSFFAIPPDKRIEHSIIDDGHPNPFGSKFIAEEAWNLFLRDHFKAYLSDPAKILE